MKERIKLEKANKTEDKATKESQQKRKNQNDAVGQKKKKKPETDDQAKIDREKDKKVKEKEDKRKKKEEEQRRKDFLLEAKKAQAAERWSSTALHATNFTPEPLRRASNPTAMPHVPVQLTTPAEPSITAPHTTPSQLTDSSSCRIPPSRTIPPSSRTTTPSSCRIPASHKTPPASGATLPSSCRIPSSSHTQDQATPSPHTAKPPARRQATTPQTSVTSRCASDLRRGIHFMSPEDFSSDDEHSEGSDTGDSRELTDEVGSCGSCCKEQNVEIEALRKRLEKLHRRLNIALKAKTVGEVIKNRPPAGVLDAALAAEYKMVEVMEGSGVYWYSHQRAYCSAFKSWSGYINASIDIFFSKDTLAASCAMGNEKKSNGHQPLNQVIIQALIGKACSKFAKDGPTPSQVVQKINMKCVEARRPPRSRRPTREK